MTNRISNPFILYCHQWRWRWEQRQKQRSEEVRAISDTIAILRDDEAHDTLAKADDGGQDIDVTLSFLQTRSDAAAKARAKRARAVLYSAAHRTGSRQLYAMAARLGFAVFDKVNVAIDKMVVDLKRQQKEEVAQRDWCGDELHKNNLNTKEQTSKAADLTTSIADQSETIERLASEIAEIQRTIAENNVQIKHAGEDREVANKEFRSAVAEQTALLGILRKARARLARVYKPALLQEAKEQAEAPAARDPENKAGRASSAKPEGFDEYKKHKGATGVIALLDRLVEKSEAEVTELTDSENREQKAYEEFVVDTNTMNTQNAEEMSNKSSYKSQAESTVEEQKADLATTKATLEDMTDLNNQLHKQCDFLIKNFDLRQQSRAEEIEAFSKAKAILKGASFKE